MLKFLAFTKPPNLISPVKTSQTFQTLWPKNKNPLIQEITQETILSPIKNKHYRDRGKSES